MSWIGDSVHALLVLLDMLGSVTRKVMRGRRTGYYREWRGRDNSGLGVLTLLGLVAMVFLGWVVLVPGCSERPNGREPGGLLEDTLLMGTYRFESDSGDTTSTNGGAMAPIGRPDSLLSSSRSVRLAAASDLSSLLMSFDTVPSSIRRVAASFVAEHTHEFALVLAQGDTSIIRLWAHMMATEFHSSDDSAASAKAIAFARTIAGRWLAYEPEERAALDRFNSLMLDSALALHDE